MQSKTGGRKEERMKDKGEEGTKEKNTERR